MSIEVKETTIIKGFGPGIVSNQVKSHSNDPVVLKKAAKAKETIDRVGLPKNEKNSEK